jgi:hypothetical protein
MYVDSLGSEDVAVSYRAVREAGEFIVMVAAVFTTIN